jgi:ABC-type Mn2+/Zn2+ transport system permease subunit
MTLAAMFKTQEWLSDPVLSEMIRWVVITALAIAVLAAPLSLLVVLKRLAFIGQGISHAAFGGWGVASVLAGASAAGGTLAFVGEFAGSTHGQLAIVYVLCLFAALVIAWLSGSSRSRGGSRARALEPDTAIGIVLVASMALGAVLNRLAANPKPWEAFLFGSIFECGPTDAWAALGAMAVVLIVLIGTRRWLTFWAFDESAALAFGVPGRAMHAMLLALLALATVVSMKLVGVVPATALLVLPGATALRLTRRWVPAIILSIVISVVGVIGGIVASLELNVLPGSSIVLVLTLLFALAPLVGRLTRRSGT